MKVKFIKKYLVYPKGMELKTTERNGKNLIYLGVAEEVKEEIEKPKRGRKPKNKEEIKDSIETK